MYIHEACIKKLAFDFLVMEFIFILCLLLPCYLPFKNSGHARVVSGFIMVPFGSGTRFIIMYKQG